MANNKTFTFTLSYQNIIWALLALNVLTIFLWKPWTSSSTADRTITVSGEATVKAEPDKYQFSPSYELTADTKEVVIEKATEKANEVVDGLKKLGVEEKDIKLNSSSYDTWWYDEENDKDYAYVSISVETNNKEFAQKIQDYLVTTSPDGQITPWPTFSDEKQKELETEARTKAIADAKDKAEQAASELGLKVGKVVTISEGYGFGDYPILYAEDMAVTSGSSRDESKSFPILPGENEYNFSISVVFELK